MKAALWIRCTFGASVILSNQMCLSFRQICENISLDLCWGEIIYVRLLLELIKNIKDLKFYENRFMHKNGSIVN